MSDLWTSHLVKSFNCELKTAFTTQHLPTAIRASLQVSSQCGPRDAKMVPSKAEHWSRYCPVHLDIVLLLLCSTCIDFCTPSAKSLGSWNAYSSHDGTMQSLNNECLHIIHSVFYTEKRRTHCSGPTLCFRENTGCMTSLYCPLKEMNKLWCNAT